MIVHDSLAVVEGRTELAIAKQEYLPDFKFGLERIISPVDGFKGWSISAGITLPIAPWTLGRASACVDEASASINKAAAYYQWSRAMVAATIKGRSDDSGRSERPSGEITDGHGTNARLRR